MGAVEYLRLHSALIIRGLAVGTVSGIVRVLSIPEMKTQLEFALATPVSDVCWMGGSLYAAFADGNIRSWNIFWEKTIAIDVAQSMTSGLFEMGEDGPRLAWNTKGNVSTQMDALDYYKGDAKAADPYFSNSELRSRGATLKWQDVASLHCENGDSRWAAAQLVATVFGNLELDSNPVIPEELLKLAQGTFLEIDFEQSVIRLPVARLISSVGSEKAFAHFTDFYQTLKKWIGYK